MGDEKYYDFLIGEMIEKWEAQTPDQIAVKWIENGKCLEKTYRQLSLDIRECSEKYLKNYRNNRIAICGKQDYRFLVLLLSILTTKNSAVIVSDFISNQENAEILKGIHTALYLSYDGAAIGIKEDVEFKEYRNCEESPKKEKRNEQEAVLLLTSGTTGRKKCVSLSHRNLLFDAYATVETILPGMPGSQLQVYGFLPFSHAFALQANIMCMLYVGGTICLGSGPADFIKEVSILKPAIIIVVPQIIKGILGYLRVHHIEKAASFPLVICGGAKLEEESIRKMQEKGIRVVQGYGSTECSPIIAVNPPANNRISSSGKCLLGLEVKIQDDEILVKGENVFSGYVNDPAATRQVFQDGFYRTGDKGWMDEEGYLYVEGRQNDTIILATGENVSPSDLEEKLMNLPSVQDAYVYEKKTGNLGCITAVIYQKGIETEVLCDIQNLNHKLEEYERIRVIEFTEAPLSRTELGKIRRIQEYKVIGKENLS